MIARRTVFCTAFVLIAIGISGLALTQTPSTPKADDPAQPAPALVEERKDDRAAIQVTLDSLRKAFEAADAKGCAAVWTNEGEYITDSGVTFRGRAEVEKSYAELFAKYPKPQVTAERQSLRFVAKDAAVEEGYFRVKLDTAVGTVTSRYSLFFIREGGTWRVAMLQEWMAEGPSLQDLEWLIGDWEGTRDEASVRATYEWDLNKSIIRGRYTVTRDGMNSTGLQILAKDPASGGLSCWTFDGSGGVGIAAWVREGNRWIVEAEGTDPDGLPMTATNLLVRVNDDVYTWQSTARTTNGEPLPDLPPVKVTRSKTKK